MRGLLTRALLTSLAAASFNLMGTAPSMTDTQCQVTDPQTGECVIWVQVPADPVTEEQDDGGVPADTGAGQACYWDPDKQGVNGPPAGPVPCATAAGYWSNAYNCYIKPIQPPPPANDPGWQGHEPGDGAVYLCYQPQTGIVIHIWSADPPDGAAAGLTPREVALIAIDSMQLRAIDIGIVPEPGPDSVGIVGMPVWMWAKTPDAQTYGPATASASAGGITVSATARVHQITWDMGDGTEVVCRTAGTPYRSAFGNRRSPDCGHRYERTSGHEADGRFTVTARSDWVITWEGAGQSGTVRLNGLERSVQITVGEAQVLVQ